MECMGCWSFLRIEKLMNAWVVGIFSSHLKEKEHALGSGIFPSHFKEEEMHVLVFPSH